MQLYYFRDCINSGNHIAQIIQLCKYTVVFPYTSTEAPHPIDKEGPSPTLSLNWKHLSLIILHSSRSTDLVIRGTDRIHFTATERACISYKEAATMNSGNFKDMISSLKTIAKTNIQKVFFCTLSDSTSFLT